MNIQFNNLTNELATQIKEVAAIKAMQYRPGNTIMTILTVSDVLSGVILATNGLGVFRITFTFGSSGYFLGNITLQMSIYSDMSSPTEPVFANGGGQVSVQRPQSGDGTVYIDCLAYGDAGSSSDQTVYFKATTSGDLTGTFSIARLL